jgi:hypothetical protein
VSTLGRCYRPNMITNSGRFRQRDLKRALKAVAEAGLVVVRVEIDQAGKGSMCTQPK